MKPKSSLSIVKVTEERNPFDGRGDWSAYIAVYHPKAAGVRKKGPTALAVGPFDSILREAKKTGAYISNQESE